MNKEKNRNDKIKRLDFKVHYRNPVINLNEKKSVIMKSALLFWKKIQTDKHKLGLLLKKIGHVMHKLKVFSFALDLELRI